MDLGQIGHRRTGHPRMSPDYSFPPSNVENERYAETYHHHGTTPLPRHDTAVDVFVVLGPGRFPSRQDQARSLSHIAFRAPYSGRLRDQGAESTGGLIAFQELGNAEIGAGTSRGRRADNARQTPRVTPLMAKSSSGVSSSSSRKMRSLMATTPHSGSRSCLPTQRHNSRESNLPNALAPRRLQRRRQQVTDQ